MAAQNYLYYVVQFKSNQRSEPVADLVLASWTYIGKDLRFACIRQPKNMRKWSSMCEILVIQNKVGINSKWTSLLLQV